jgi:hypothetical protein
MGLPPHPVALSYPPVLVTSGLREGLLDRVHGGVDSSEPPDLPNIEPAEKSPQIADPRWDAASRGFMGLARAKATRRKPLWRATTKNGRKGAIRAWARGGRAPGTCWQTDPGLLISGRYEQERGVCRVSG